MGIKSKVDGLGEFNLAVQKTKSGRPAKVDGLRKWTVMKSISGRSERQKLGGTKLDRIDDQKTVQFGPIPSTFGDRPLSRDCSL